MNCYKCVLEGNPKEMYQPQHLYLTPRPLKWVTLMEIKVWVPEDFYTFYNETRRRVLTYERTEIREQFNYNVPFKIQKLRWKIYKKQKTNDAPI